MILPYSEWMKTNLGTRQKIAQLFGIAKLRSIHVSNNVVVDDGYNIKQVEDALNLTALQNFLSSTETNIIELFRHLVGVMEGTVTEFAPVLEETATVTVSDKPKKPRKTKKK